MTEIDPLGPILLDLRREHGLTLDALERKTGGEWKAVVVGSYERGDRHPTVAKARRLLAFYDHRLEVVGPDDVLVTHQGGQNTVQWLVLVAGLEFPCHSRYHAEQLASGNPAAKVGFRTITTSPLTVLEEVTVG